MKKFRPKSYTEYIKENENTINKTLNFKGYFSDNDEIPTTNGVYAAFAEDQDSHNKYRLLYIGRAYETNNLKKRIGEHIRYDHNSEKWLEHYDPETESIFYSYAEINDDSIIPDIERALIYENQPPINDQDIENNNIECDRVSLRCNGDKGTLLSGFVLDRDDE